ncbi:cation:proton antiporter [Saccharothrix sp. BKS2]|uniref:cation:proton antiporter n=1 Tax=Saccharothrix sp. BKS2 TaxID=3064400 RepID=UPI0039E880E9
MDAVVTALHFATALGAVLLVAAAGRAVARALRQPPVVGEVAAGLLVVPALVLLAGPAAPGTVLPAPVLAGLGVVAEVGLAWFLVGVATELRFGARGRALRRVVVGGLVPGAAAGIGVGWWVVAAAPAAVRGNAPPAALVVFTAVAMAVTAVPVLARVLVECGLSGTRSAALSLGAAVVGDVVCWLGLTVALGLAAGAADAAGTANGANAAGGWPARLAGLGACAAVALLGRRVLASPTPERWAARWPRRAALLPVVAAPAGAAVAEAVGVSALIGAAAVALAVPRGQAWTAVARSVGRLGVAVVPVFFVVAGATAWAVPDAGVPWGLAAVVLVLGSVTKIAGGWAGARLAGEAPGTALRVGVLLNTRGLTELVVLQVGLTSGVLSAPLFLALAVMALVTTATTGPLLALLDRRATLVFSPGDAGSGAPGDRAATR